MIGLAGLLATLVAATGAVSTQSAAAASWVRLTPHGPSYSLTRTLPAGEGELTVTAGAAGVDWSVRGHESAVLSVDLDGRHVADLVVLTALPATRQILLGSVTAGRHTLRLGFSSASRPGARSITVTRATVQVIRPSDPQYTVTRFAPVLYGRTTASDGGPLQNTWTDTPLLAWHEESAASTPGHRILVYSVIWSNEDGGTNTPSLLARWGRTTDIEWIYRVEVDAAGNRVPGTGVYQAPFHLTLPFLGRYEGDHPVLQTCTLNNNVCDRARGTTLRFFPSVTQTRPDDRAREELMDANPWTYRVMWQEARREKRFEAHPSPFTVATSDLRNYLYLETDKTTTPANPDSEFGKWLGTAYGARLAGSPIIYWSNHLIPTSSIQRDIPAATAIELPRGRSVRDVVAIYARRVPVHGYSGDGTVTVTRLARGFTLNVFAYPTASVISWTGSVTLTAAAPTALIWHR
jgi:hypothetical protein